MMFFFKKFTVHIEEHKWEENKTVETMLLKGHKNGVYCLRPLVMATFWMTDFPIVKCNWPELDGMLFSSY